MSRHEGVSCDSCLKSNFRGRRYKCLICYDYDLCANCYEEGATSTRHSADHPMQCILTRSDFELYYGGEVLTPEQPQSFTCPYCKKMGLSDSALLEHVSSEHTDTGLEVVCPVCAALPGGDPNLVTDDFAGHLSLEHRTGSRDLISFLDEPSAIRHGGVRRIPHSGRALGGPRSRRSNMHFSSSGGGLSTLSPSGRADSVDPIAELLQQLSSVRRGGASQQIPQPSQLQQLQMQIQLERQQVSAARQQLERLPRRQAQPVVSSSSSSSNATGGTGSNSQSQFIISLNGNGRDQLTASGLAACNILGGVTAAQSQSQFLMARFMVPSLDDAELAQLERDRADRSQYVQALMLSTIANVQSSASKTQEDELREEMSNLNLGVGNINNNSNVNNNVKKSQDDEAGDIKNDEENCDNVRQSATMDDLHQAQVLSRGLQQQNSHHQQQPSTKPKPSKSMSSACGGGGVVDRRNRPPPSTNPAKARDLKQSNSSSNTAPSTKHVPDSR